MSLRTLPLQHHFLVPDPQLRKFHSKRRHWQFRKSANPHILKSAGAGTPGNGTDTHSPNGAGAAAPIRGDLFLQCRRDSGAIQAAPKKKERRRDKAAKVYDPGVSCCYGCGAPLQTADLDAPGYVDLGTYELKKKHHQLRTILCRRCQLLSHGHMITAVGGNGGYPGGKQFVTAEQLREKLSYLRFEKALIVKLVDIVDFSGSLLSRVRDIVGPNPIILVVTKIDLLPKGTDLNCIGDWVVEAISKKKLNVLSVHLTSSKSLVGIAGVAAEVKREKKGRDVYILGAANVGKSAFINALLKLMAEKDPVASAAQKYKPIQSAVPGTTLGPIQIDAFLGGGKLYDTPGIHLHHRQAAVVPLDDLPVLAPKSRLKGWSLPNAVLGDNTAEKHGCGDLSGFSVFWGGLVRIDILKCPPRMRLTFYGPRALQIHMVPSDKADQFYQRELGVLLAPPTLKDRAYEWEGLETKRHLQMTIEDRTRPACDVAISGLGWFSVAPTNESHSDLQLTEFDVHLLVHVPKPVETFVRPPMPVGKTGAEWYQYRELTEEEEELRPKLHF